MREEEGSNKPFGGARQKIRSHIEDPTYSVAARITSSNLEDQESVGQHNCCNILATSTDKGNWVWLKFELPLELKQQIIFVVFDPGGDR